MTKQRQVILEELHQTESHPTAAELYERVRKRLPHISLGTVYRNLERLSHEGVVRKLGGSAKEARFDSDLTDHYHIRCFRCGRTDDFMNSHKVEIDQPPDECRGWQIDQHRIEFVGLCPDCRTVQ